MSWKPWETNAVLFYRMGTEPWVTTVWAFRRFQTGWGENKNGPSWLGNEDKVAQVIPLSGLVQVLGATHGGT